MQDVMVPDAERCERGDDRLTNAVYLDVIALATNHGLDLAAVALDLERIARTGQAAPLAAAGLAVKRS